MHFLMRVLRIGFALLRSRGFDSPHRRVFDVRLRERQQPLNFDGVSGVATDGKLPHRGALVDEIGGHALDVLDLRGSARIEIRADPALAEC
jgi:hypothetical protein